MFTLCCKLVILFFRKQREIESRKAPQVLKIDHDDAVSLSGDDESIDSELDDDADDQRAMTQAESSYPWQSAATNGFSNSDVALTSDASTKATGDDSLYLY